MYRIDIKNEVVREIQRFLLSISYRENTTYLPHISIDGIYDKETTEAVEKFQDRYGLDVTGKVDFLTWNLIYRKFLE